MHIFRELEIYFVSALLEVPVYKYSCNTKAHLLLVYYYYFLESHHKGICALSLVRCHYFGCYD
jgi:hypothetical protein